MELVESFSRHLTRWICHCETHLMADLVIGRKGVRIREGMLASMTMVGGFDSEHCE